MASESDSNKGARDLNVAPVVGFTCTRTLITVSCWFKVLGVGVYRPGVKALEFCMCPLYLTCVLYQLAILGLEFASVVPGVQASQ